MIIWLTSYPKSGNTWVRSFLSAYYFSQDGDFNFNLLESFKQFPSKDFVNLNLKNPLDIVKQWEPVQEDILSKKKIVFLKTHNALISLNNTKFTSPKYTLGFIYIIRDPRNLITSLKNHTDISYEEALSFMLDKNTVLYDTKVNDYDAAHFISSWRMHYKSWLNNDVFKKMIIRYEDLENNSHEIFYKLINFTNSLMKRNDKVDEKKLEKAIETTNFNNLRKKEENGEFNENAISLKTNEKVKFFNMGYKNNWNKILPQELKIKLNDKFKDDISYLRY
tara:strand:- start:1106 stop:1939 length:834 start_codon:yes stop_codon:yes gene_type:complete